MLLCSVLCSLIFSSLRFALLSALFAVLHALHSFRLGCRCNSTGGGPRAGTIVGHVELLDRFAKCEGHPEGGLTRGVGF